MVREGHPGQSDVIDVDTAHPMACILHQRRRVLVGKAREEFQQNFFACDYPLALVSGTVQVAALEL